MHLLRANESLLGAKNKNKFQLISAVAKNKLNSRRKKKIKVIDELKIYESELEQVGDFGGFTDLFHSFELYRGKVCDLFTYYPVIVCNFSNLCRCL